LPFPDEVSSDAGSGFENGPNKDTIELSGGESSFFSGSGVGVVSSSLFGLAKRPQLIDSPKKY
jgi:hypothetical protein